MDYLFENLGPERFQQFCQALLIREFPNLQCFPIAQPDGGRDAIVLRGSSNDFGVFQVKFVRNPSKEDDPHRWLEHVMSKEIPKIKGLIPKGARNYYLLTNVSGTAHLDKGSIDKLQALLADLGLPAMCWWRDDLNSRVDGRWDLKWSYPEILTGTDMLRFIVENGLSEHKERRHNALRAFVRDQYETDKTIKFKQIDLQNSLLDLFIDLPITLARASVRHDKRRPLQSYSDEFAAGSVISHFEQQYFTPGSGESNGAVAALLRDPCPPKIVLEGAPGQGKSTVGQYLCQVHRMRILRKERELERIPKTHRDSAVRFPIRVDIRDFATWLRREDPFSPDDSRIQPTGWHRSLEAFLAALIKHHSGGIEFTSGDLSAVGKITSLLVVLDGLDEVADISIRREVVEEITKGVNRLEENVASLQVVVTSRPTAFANTPGLPAQTFPHLELDSVTRHQIDEYAEKWTRARQLSEVESSEVRGILREKLNQPHLRDLARNPMQLAILLSLIHTRGSSLPDKRTALYDAYIELFFNRESEKSSIVRKNRDLLIDIHQYLAWKLHSEAEVGGERGNIAADRLRVVLREYLVAQQRDSSLVEEVFTGMVERVVALVSRVQGTYEFEVQPLREYFAARYLYETAPYSPPGNEKKGTKPDRFDAIARNFYWLNVVRFFSGCFSKGELPGLGERLEELAKEDGYRETNHPQSLAAMLLADWVFAQNPRVTRRVLALVLDSLGLCYLAGYDPDRYSRRTAKAFVLPSEGGRLEVVAHCFNLLRGETKSDFAEQLISVINTHTSVSERLELWLKECQSVSCSDRDKWLAYGCQLGTLVKVPPLELTALLSDDEVTSKRVQFLLESDQARYCESSPLLIERAVESILDDGIVFWRTKPDQQLSYLNWLAFALNPSLPFSALQYGQTIRLRDFIAREMWPFDVPEEIERTNLNPLLTKCRDIGLVAKLEFLRPSADWTSSLEPWNNIIEKTSKAFGVRWANYRLANAAAGIRSKEVTASQYDELHDSGAPLSYRARYARLRSGVPNWWSRQIDTAPDALASLGTLLILLTWGSGPTLVSLSERVDKMVQGLDSASWLRLIRAVLSVTFGTRSSSLDLSRLPGSADPRTMVALAARTDPETRIEIYDKHFRNYEGNDPIICGFCYGSAINKAIRNPVEWSSSLKTIQAQYRNDSVNNSGYWTQESSLLNKLPLEAARAVIQDAANFPIDLVRQAESVCRIALSDRIQPVRMTAEDESWFSTIGQ
jgi:hypothetical protein